MSALNVSQIEHYRPAKVAHSSPFIDFTQLETLADPEWLVEGLITRGSYSVFYGQSGAGKRFLVLDLALCVATGVPFHGRSVSQGPIVYVMAEGSGGAKARFRAWKKRGATVLPGKAHLHREEVDLLSRSAVLAFLADLKRLPVPPSLIVFDTFARCFTGDENEAKDVMTATANIDLLRRETGAAVILVHHSMKNKDSVIRGSSALKGAADSMFRVERRRNDYVVLTNEKQKDAEPAPTLQFQCVSHEVGKNADGSPMRSLTLELVGAVDSLECTANRSLGPVHRSLLAVLGEWPEPVRVGVWRAAVPSISRDSFNKRLKDLKDAGMVQETDNHCYCLTDAGRALVPSCRVPSVP